MIQNAQAAMQPDLLSVAPRENQDPYDLTSSCASEAIKTLVLNCGSSSLKYSLFDNVQALLLLEGEIKKIGSRDAVHKVNAPRTNGKDDQKNVMTIKDAFDVILCTVTDSACQAISKLSDLNTVGHRVLHGGAAFADAVLINENIIKSIRASCDLAPLHNPYNLAGIEVMRRLLPSITQVAVLTPPSTRSCPVMHIYLDSSP